MDVAGWSEVGVSPWSSLVVWSPEFFEVMLLTYCRFGTEPTRIVGRALIPQDDPGTHRVKAGSSA